MALARLPSTLVLVRRSGRLCSTSADPASVPAFQQRWLEQRDSRELMRDKAFDDELETRAYRQREGTQRLDCENKESHEQRYTIGQVARLGREKRWEEALKVFERIENPCTVLRASVVDACVKSQQASFAQRLFDEMPSRTLPAYNSMMNLYGRLRKVREVEALLMAMRKSCFTPTVITYGSLIMAHGEVEDLQSALRVFEEMISAGIPPNAVLFMTIISACAKVGDHVRASQLLERMRPSGVTPNVGHFTGVITACARSGNEKRAIEIFEELSTNSVKPDVVLYTSLMRCFHGRDALSKAQALLVKMEAEGLTPNIATYSTLLQAALKSRARDEFDELIVQMEKKGIPRNHKINILVRQMQDVRGGKHSVQHSLLLKPDAAATLAEGWRETKDPVSGCMYFWRDADPSGSVTWVRPN